MTALEIRIIAYAVGFLLVVGMTAWAVHTLDAHHYERIEAAEKAAQADLLAEAQRNVIAAQTAQRAAETKVETEHELRTQADTVSRAAVLSSVRGLETAVHQRILSAAMANPSAVQTGQPSAAGDDRLARLIEGFDGSLERFITACQSVDNDRTAILSLEPQVTP